MNSRRKFRLTVQTNNLKNLLRKCYKLLHLFQLQPLLLFSIFLFQEGHKVRFLSMLFAFLFFFFFFVIFFFLINCFVFSYFLMEVNAVPLKNCGNLFGMTNASLIVAFASFKPAISSQRIFSSFTIV
jgi:hypothetical protein